MTVREEAEMYRYAQIAYGLFRTMLEKRRFKDVPVHLPCGVSDDPRQAAKLTRSALGLAPNSPIPHLINSLERAGVLVIALPKPFEHRDAFSLWAGFNRQRPVIVLGGGKSGDRLRFNVAHETAHLVMHKPLTNSVPEVEKQAQQFAAELLMPEEAMRMEITLPVTLDSIAPLKRRWGVAIQALIVRARELEIISPRLYTSLFQRLSRLAHKGTQVI